MDVLAEGNDRLLAQRLFAFWDGQFLAERIHCHLHQYFARVVRRNDVQGCFGSVVDGVYVLARRNVLVGKAVTVLAYRDVMQHGTQVVLVGCDTFHMRKVGVKHLVFHVRTLCTRKQNVVLAVKLRNELRHKFQRVDVEVVA